MSKCSKRRRPTSPNSTASNSPSTRLPNFSNAKFTELQNHSFPCPVPPRTAQKLAMNYPGRINLESRTDAEPGEIRGHCAAREKGELLLTTKRDERAEKSGEMTTGGAARKTSRAVRGRKNPARISTQEERRIARTRGSLGIRAAAGHRSWILLKI